MSKKVKDSETGDNIVSREGPRWGLTTIGEVIGLQRGYDITRTKQEPGKIPVISSSGISSFHSKSMTNGPGVVIGRKGTLGTVFYSEAPYWPHDTTLWVRDFKGNHPRFVYYFLQTLDTQWLNFGSANPTLNRNHLYPLATVWPRIDIQYAIAEVLGALDDKIAANRRVIETARRLLIAEWSRSKTTSTHQVRLDEIAQIQPSTRATNLASAPYLEMKNLPEQGLLVADWDSRPAQGGARFKNGDTLLARITPCFQNGKMGWIDFLGEDEVGIGSTEFIVLRARNNLPEFLPYVIINEPAFYGFAEKRMVGTSGRQRVQASEIGDYVVRIPTTQALQHFSAMANPLLSKLGRLRDENTVIASTRDELLPLLMSGKITVRDAELAAEEAL